MDRARLPAGDRARLSPGKTRVLQPRGSLERRSPRRLGIRERLTYFGLAEGDGEGFAGALGAAEVVGIGFAAGVVPGTCVVGAPGAMVGDGWAMLSSSTSKIRVALGPIVWPAPRSP